MSYEVEVTSYFKKQAKRLIKKFPSLKGEIDKLINLLEIEPAQGSSVGNDCFKVRLAIASKGKGKSGGARIIFHVHYKNNRVFLLSIYDKSEQADIDDKEILSLLDSLQTQK